jgi:tyrosyl-tRNA synthetase
MNKALQTLKERGFYSQCTDGDGLSALMDSSVGNGGVTFYVGCDPTGDSLHIGHMVPFFAFRHLLEAGNKGIALIGGGTARIGDPSGKTEMRKILSYDTIDANVGAIRKQLTDFLGKATAGCSGTFDFANNKDWLADLNYIDFLREIGSQFSVNHMLSFEAYKKRLETGLSFLEFNYQLLQSYDFLQLYERYGCCLQIGGDDQWGNIVAGADLIRRMHGDDKAAKNGAVVYGLTFPLITRSDGKKMGKSEKGAIFLDAAKTPVYDFYQYWRNTGDPDVKRFLLMFTFLDVGEIEKLCAAGTNPNAAKERLAWEVTALVHGKDEADKAMAAARAAFGGGKAGAEDLAALPTVEMSRARFEAGFNVVDLFFEAKLASSKSDARRLVQQSGAVVGGSPITDVKALVGTDKLDAEGCLVLRAGKKRYCRVKTV